MTYYNGMTMDEIADWSMSEEHSRFDEDHRKICEDCYAGYVDFCQEQADDARLDAMINAEAGETEAQ